MAAKAFRESRRIRRAPVNRLTMGVVLAACAGSAYVALAVPPIAPLVLPVAGVFLVADALMVVGGVDTTVSDGVLTIRVVPGVTRRIPCREIVSAEVTVNDLAAGLFGGWSDHAHPTVAGDSYGARGVRVVTASGREQLVGTMRPAELLDAIRAQGGTRLGPGA